MQCIYRYSEETHANKYSVYTLLKSQTLYNNNNNNNCIYYIPWLTFY